VLKEEEKEEPERRIERQNKSSAERQKETPDPGKRWRKKRAKWGELDLLKNIKNTTKIMEKIIV